ncbi:MAG: L-tyrosine/L-tryptophan isonitrile synthase family protein [Candidatus Andersenbacteria bacterium]
MMAQEKPQEPLVTTEWILENLSVTIIYKDFDISSLHFAPLHTIKKKVLPCFDTNKLVNEIYLPNREAHTIAEKVLSILLNSNVRRGSFSIIAKYIPIFLEKINRSIQSGQPITLILPAMPHKKLSPITTGHSIDFVDLGEYLCFQQMKNIINSISKVYSGGVKIILVPDGVVLAHCFAENDIDGILAYQNKLRNVCEELGLSSVIDIVDLQSIVLTDSRFIHVKEAIAQQLYMLEETNEDVRKGLDILKKAMFFNVPFSHSLAQHIDLMKRTRADVPANILNKLDSAAVEYISIVLALKRLNLIEKAFPNGIRMSVHSKRVPSIPVNLINDTSQIFPYNGVPVVRQIKYSRNHNLRTSTRIMRLYEVYNHPSVCAVYIKGQQEPFYYEISSLREVV